MVYEYSLDFISVSHRFPKLEPWRLEFVDVGLLTTYALRSVSYAYYVIHTGTGHSTYTFISPPTGFMHGYCMIGPLTLAGQDRRGCKFQVVRRHLSSPMIRLTQPSTLWSLLAALYTSSLEVRRYLIYGGVSCLGIQRV